eukprot:scaffold63062_cov23-Tisochrysis_lutea.AAC.1
METAMNPTTGIGDPSARQATSDRSLRAAGRPSPSLRNHALLQRQGLFFPPCTAQPPTVPQLRKQRMSALLLSYMYGYLNRGAYEVSVGGHNRLANEVPIVVHMGLSKGAYEVSIEVQMRGDAYEVPAASVECSSIAYHHRAYHCQCMPPKFVINNVQPQALPWRACILISAQGLCRASFLAPYFYAVLLLCPPAMTKSQKSRGDLKSAKEWKR